MSSYPFKYYIEAPLADIAGVLSAVGLTSMNPAYTAADPAIRAQTHGRTSFLYSPAQETAIETPSTGARAMFPDTLFEKYDAKDAAGLPTQRLAEAGLTTSATI